MDIQWDNEASLMRITAFDTAEPQEELVARGTVYELVGQVLEMAPGQQGGLLLRTSGPDWSREFDTDAIRELAARPEYTSAHGAYDTADRPADDEAELTDDEDTLIGGDVSGPDHTNALGRDGEK